MHRASAASEKLAEKDKQAIIKIVTTQGRITAHPLDGEWANYTVIIVPVQIKEYYAKHPRETLIVLRGIIEKGSVQDALTAAGYGLALVTNPVVGFLASSYPEGKFDEKNPNTGKSRRQSLVNTIDKLLPK